MKPTEKQTLSFRMTIAELEASLKKKSAHQAGTLGMTKPHIYTTSVHVNY